MSGGWHESAQARIDSIGTYGEWGIRIRNWHRPLQTYMTALLDAGFSLRHFAEPAPLGINDDKTDRYHHAPNFLLIEWQKAA